MIVSDGISSYNQLQIQLFSELAIAAPSGFFLLFLSRNEEEKSFTESNRLGKLLFYHERRLLGQTAIRSLIFWIHPAHNYRRSFLSHTGSVGISTDSQYVY
jgi:hypothetical protein